MHYIPVCAPAIAPSTTQELRDYLAETPMLQFDDRDMLPIEFMDQLAMSAHPSAHFIPSNREYFDAVRLGLGWSVLPEGQLEPALENDELVLLHPTERIEVALYWQRWRVASSALDEVSDLVRRAASSVLH